jgi:hypothetical protein
MADPVLALIDYDNVRARDELNERDVESNLLQIVSTVVAEAAREFHRPRELLLRVYGGWVDEQAQRTRRGQWVLVGLTWYRGRSGPTIVKPTLVMSLACRPRDILVGTARQTPKGLRQKMVDSMVAIDVRHFARNAGAQIIVYSDDDDLVPGLLSATTYDHTVRVHWLRHRKVGSGMNDHLLRRAGITVASTS